MPSRASQFPARADLTLCEFRGAPVVLRRHVGARVGTVRWTHQYLARLAPLAIATPVPVSFYAGESVALVDGAVCSAVTYVEGEVVGWAARPSMFEMGAYLASFHEATREVTVDRQQEPAYPVEALPAPMLDEYGIDLDAISHTHQPRRVIHGDFTNHNVLAAGDPPRACGVIDFANAYIEATLADLGFALWRSGRSTQDSTAYDPDRVRAYLDGYDSVQPLSAGDRHAAVTYLMARGVQILVKQAARGVVDDGPRRRLEWLRANAVRLA